ncbi:MAG: multicopper oxidase domain-containing protein [Gammaproteobacteria bacterium]|nr:multicopper oxidase domain-containing protein [Gammaproteobacteria bacterium]
MYVRKIIKCILLSCLVFYVSVLNASQCPSTNVVTDPVMFEWTYHPVTASNAEEYYSGTLEMGEVTLNINGETLTTRAYRQEGFNYSIPGPTMYMAPGKKYLLRFKNTLPYQPLSADHNVFKDPNVTNVHTHGLHVSGETPSDDVTRFFEGGFGGDFVYDIPADHMGGTYWYHAHHHGSTFLQVSSGAFGQIIIDDSFDGIPANVANMEEKLLQIVYLDPSVAGTSGDTLISGTLNPGWTVNGKVSGNVCLPPNTWQHWRILLGDADAKTKTLSIGNQCEVALMARDGVWRTVVPKNIADNSLPLTGASRADIAVRCSGDSTITVANTVVANIFVDGASDLTVHPYAEDGVSQWNSFRPAYLRDLRNEAVSNFETVNMGARTVNGSKFDIDVPTFTTVADGVQEWNVKGATNHPFHLHVYHFQTQENCGDYEAGEYYDTMAAACNVRFDLNPATSTVYEGKTILHCHILDHEDQGAMGWMNVIGGEAAPLFPVDTSIDPYKTYYSLGGAPAPTVPAAPTALAALAVSSSQIDLSWADNANDEASYQLERSLDGINFSSVAILAANSTSYSDVNLNASTTYHYQVNASNTAGTSANSNIASATTEASTGGGTGTSVRVGSIIVTTSSVGGGLKLGVADIVVLDDLGNPVENAIVSGEFTGAINEVVSASGATNVNGQTSVNTTQTVKGKVTLSFCVTAITHDTLQDFSAVPGEVCGTL